MKMIPIANYMPGILEPLEETDISFADGNRAYSRRYILIAVIDVYLRYSICFCYLIKYITFT